MDLFKTMQRITKGEPIEEPKSENEINEQNRKKIGTVIRGIITKVFEKNETRKKKGGFAFIISDELPYERIFLHWSGLRQDTLRFHELKEKMKVEFLLQYSEPTEKHDGGYRAIKTKVIE